jgi:hypothetical protein
MVLWVALAVSSTGCGGPCQSTDHFLAFSGTSEMHAASGFTSAPKGTGDAVDLNSDWTLDPDGQPIFTLNAGVPNSGTAPTATVLGRLQTLNTLFVGKRFDELEGDELSVGQTFSEADANISWCTDVVCDGGIFTPSLDYVVVAYGKAASPSSSADGGDGGPFLTLSFTGTDGANSVQGSVSLSLAERIDTDPCCFGGGACDN